MFNTLDGTVLSTWQVHQTLDALVDEDKGNGAYDELVNAWIETDRELWERGTDHTFTPDTARYDDDYRTMLWEDYTFRFENDLEGWIEQFGEYNFFNDRGDIVGDTKALHAQATLLIGLHPFATLEAVIEQQRVVIRATGQLEAYQLGNTGTTVFVYVTRE